MKAAISLLFSLIALSASASERVCNRWKFAGFQHHTFAQQLSLKVTETEVMTSSVYGGLSRAKTVWVTDETGQHPLADLLPKVVQQTSGNFQSKDKLANCYNAVVNWFSPSSDIRYSEEEEFTKLISEEFVELSDGETVQMGDVITLSHFPEEDHLFHVAVYVDSGIYWHKPSHDSTDPWTFQDLNPLLSRLCSAGNEIYVKFYRKK